MWNKGLSWYYLGVSSPSSPSARDPFLAGDFLVVPERNELRRLDLVSGRPDGEPYRLTSKQMDVLVALASKPGQPLSKTELFETVWPGVTVGEDNISSCVYELRKAFGNPGYIQNVRSRGYLLAPAVVRPLPTRVLEALEPARNESAEILLSNLDVEYLRAPSPPELPPQAEPEPLPARIPDRQLRRNLAIAFGALALLVVSGLATVRHIGNFTVGIPDCKNLTGEPDLNPTLDQLRDNFVTQLDAPIGETYYRIRNLSFFANTQVSCSLERDPDPKIDGYILKASVIGQDGKSSGPIRMYPKRDGIARVGGQLIESVRRELDRQACLMDAEDDLIKARHCLGAGKRLVKTRSIVEAEVVLLRAAEIYTAQLAMQLEAKERAAAVVALLEARDALSNAYDILGQRDQAEEQIKAALAVVENPASGFDLEKLEHKKIRLKILRRSAQIEDNVPLEKERLDELLNLDHRDADVLHSRGWFLLTHERACGSYPLSRFDEAIDGETDPLVRDTYNSYKGDIQLACGHPKEAIDFYNQHIALLPEEADPYDGRASAYIMMGRYQEARDDLAIARKLDHNLASVFLKKGELDRDLGNFQDAKREYLSALGNFGQWPNDKRDILIGLGRLALLEDRAEEAWEKARDAINPRGGNQVQPYWLLGIASLALGRPDEAHAALGVLEKHFAQTTSKYLREYLHHLRAQLMLSEGRGEEALAELDAAFENYPTDRLFFLNAKAEALEKLGRDAEAFTTYRAFRAINPYHPRATCAAAAIAKRLKLPEAAALYAQAQDILDDTSQDPVCQSCLDRARAF